MLLWHLSSKWCRNNVKMTENVILHNVHLLATCDTRKTNPTLGMYSKRSPTVQPMGKNRWEACGKNIAAKQAYYRSRHLEILDESWHNLISQLVLKAQLRTKKHARYWGGFYNGFHRKYRGVGPTNDTIQGTLYHSLTLFSLRVEREREREAIERE